MLDVPIGHEWHKLSIQPVGEWGLLPNLDIISVVTRVAHHAGFRDILMCEPIHYEYTIHSFVRSFMGWLVGWLIGMHIIAHEMV